MLSGSMNRFLAPAPIVGTMVYRTRAIGGFVSGRTIATNDAFPIHESERIEKETSTGRHLYISIYHTDKHRPGRAPSTPALAIRRMARRSTPPLRGVGLDVFDLVQATHGGGNTRHVTD